ncbi:hypothetical protein [Companilactobacillus zhongbaensis]|uniref:hypothetical protein n=1 Tax=Companilactobacillus zhongbaensis TaxID=2486009 RepID=UPI000F7A4415|nr:hypothetical protein [Companilactobacillus zhongbaensis]
MTGKKYLSFEIALGILLTATIILFLVNKNKTEAIFAAVATMIAGGALFYFKMEDHLKKREAKKRKMHLDK